MKAYGLFNTNDKGQGFCILDAVRHNIALQQLGRYEEEAG
jgi:hypothetical protein